MTLTEEEKQFIEEKLNIIVNEKLKTIVRPQEGFNVTGAYEYVGVGPTTFWKWRKKGLIKPVFIDGIQLF